MHTHHADGMRTCTHIPRRQACIHPCTLALNDIPPCMHSHTQTPHALPPLPYANTARSAPAHTLHARAFVHIGTNIHTHTHTHTHITNTHTHRHTRTHAGIHTCMQAGQTHTHTHTHTHIHTHTHTCLHTGVIHTGATGTRVQAGMQGGNKENLQRLVQEFRTSQGGFFEHLTW